MKKLGLAIALLAFAIAPTAYADSAPGDEIVILGENLTQAQKEMVLEDLNPGKDALMLTVTNKEEHQYLGSYLSPVKIGTKALSSAKITIGESGSGISVASTHINWVTNDMYLNAMITAGVKDAKVEITAPFDVSGTAALTGIVKAYEKSTGEKIPEEQKQVANEEIVKSAELADSIGAEDTSTLMTTIKEKMAEEKPQTREEVEAIVNESANDLKIEIPKEQLTGLVDLYENMKDAGIDWNAVGDELEKAKDKFTDFINSEETKNFFAKIGEFFKNLFDIIAGWFK